MYNERQLFDGAISCEMPTSSRDVSTDLSLAHHQEIWEISDDAFLVVAIVPRREADDENAAAFFFHSFDTIYTIGRSSFLPENSLLPTKIEGATACAGIGYRTITVANDDDFSGQPMLQLWVELCVLRLAPVDTDLFMYIIRPRANPNEAPDEALTKLFLRAISSIEIRDWERFESITSQNL